MTGKKSYDQYCGVARALDVVGERWTLLVVRELYGGPKRYTDLIAGIPGIATDMLAARLKTLEENELVARRVLPPPAASTVYELTELGRRLEPVLEELGRFGLQILGKRKDESFRIDWLVLPVRTMFRPERAGNTTMVVQFESNDGEAFHARIANGAIETATGPHDAPDVVFAGDVETLARASKDKSVAEEAVARGKLKMRGNKKDIVRVLEMLGIKKT
ncbi:MAG TPA: winged helix-turn-helix transcriptional regulator [Thermoanaerobaculia bacterium]